MLHGHSILRLGLKVALLQKACQLHKRDKGHVEGGDLHNMLQGGS